MIQLGYYFRKNVIVLEKIHFDLTVEVISKDSERHFDKYVIINTIYPICIFK